MVIVLLEDNPGDIYIISEQLKEIYPEYDLMVITNGKNARNYFVNLEQNPQLDHPDLLILDSKLPGADGLELLSMIREFESLRKISIVMLSGSENEEAKQKALSSGADQYFVKPADLGEYHALIVRMVNIAEEKNKSN